MEVLEWQLAWADYIDFLLKLQEEGEEVQALDERPVLHQDLQIAWDCFREAHKARQTGLSGTNPLAIADIRAWLEVNGAELEEMAQLLVYVQLLDETWRRWAQEKQAEAQAQPEETDDGDTKRGD